MPTELIDTIDQEGYPVPIFNNSRMRTPLFMQTKFLEISSYQAVFRKACLSATGECMMSYHDAPSPVER